MGKSKKSFGRRLAGKLGAGAFKFARLMLVRKDPISAERVGKKMGRLIFRVGKKQRTRCLSNLKLVFPELTDAERLDLAKRCFEHFGILTADFLRADIRPKNEAVDSVVEVEGREFAEEAWSQDKGLLAITAHFGNWERAAAWSDAQGFPLTVVQRDANDEGMNEIVTKLRKASGVEVLSRGNAARGILQALRENKIVAILADQNADECFVPFMGHMAGTVLGPAVMSMRTGAPLLPNYCVRLGPNKYKIVAHPAMYPDPNAENQAEDLMTRLNASLESMIREHPEQWLWFHDRWKSARRKGLVSEP